MTLIGYKREKREKLTRVISTANGNLLVKLVVALDTTNTLHAKLLGKVGVGEVELAVAALETTNGLAGGTLGAGPLGLLVTSRARVGAHGTSVATVTSDGSDDIADQLVHEGNVLDTRPATKAKVVKRDGTIVRGEGATVELTVGEVSVETGGRTTGAAAARGTGGGSRGGRRAGGFRRGGWGGGGRGRGLEELSRLDRRSRSGSRGRSRRGAAGGALAGLRRGDTVSPQEGTVSDTLANIGSTDPLAVELVFEDGAGGVNGTASVTVLVVVRLGSHQAGGGQGEGNRVELHCVSFRISSIGKVDDLYARWISMTESGHIAFLIGGSPQSGV